MAGITPANRSRMRPFRSLRRRPENDDNYIQLDWSKGTTANMHEVLYKIVHENDSPKATKLAYLNCFTKICSKIASDACAKGLGFLPEEIFCCLRVALLDEAYDVRAAGLRAMRHFMLDEVTARAFIHSNGVHLVVRSLDINLDNKMERLQALRLLRHLIGVVPADVPVSAARALVAIARDGLQDSDNLTRPCWAAVAELCLRSPSVAATAGCFSALVDTVLQTNVPPAISESLIGTIIYSMNEPSLRDHLRDDQDLQHFVAPFTDCYSPNPTTGNADQNFETNEQRDAKFLAAKRAILTIMRSWPGLIYFCRYSCDSSRGSNAMQSLIETLHMPFEETRRNILELLFDLLNLRMPTLPAEDVMEFSFDILSSYHMWAMQDSWQVYDGFVAAEGKSLLAHVSRSRINLFDNYLSIVLYSLVSYGIVEALVQVIITPKQMMFSNSIRATVLLAEILHLSSRLLPHEVYRKCHALPDLVNAATCPSHSLEVRGIASTAIAALDRMHALRKTAVLPFSLYLDQVMRVANLSNLPHLSDTKSRLLLKLSVAHEAEEITDSYVRDSNVLTHDSSNYNWNLISSILSWPTDNFKRLEDLSYRMFLKKLLDFFRPSGRGFSQSDVNDEHGREMALVCCHFVEFLLDIDDVRSAEFLGEFGRDLVSSLSQISVANPPQNAILSPTKLMTTLSHYYFLVIGRMTSSNKGSKLLENLGFYQHLSFLVTYSCHDIYTKLIISSLDYTKEGFCRKILIKSLTTGSESSRLYATNFMLVLLRVHVPDFHKWALPLLVHQMYDECDSVSLSAAGVLLECCDQKQNLEALIHLKPSLMHLKHCGLLLQVRFASVPIGIKFLTETRMLDALLADWRNTSNLKYVKIVEDAINEALTMHVRSEGGTYGSRRSEKKSVERNTFLPPHLYGQMAEMELGMKLLIGDDCLTPLFAVIRAQDLSCERKMLEMKASLWAVGHVMSVPLGLSYVAENDGDIISLIMRMTTECSVLSLRGTCFYVLGMMAMTEQGIHRLEHFGWQGLKHCRHEVWPLEDRQPDHQNLFQCYSQGKHCPSSVCSSIGFRGVDDRKQSLRSENDQDSNSCYSPNQDESRSRTSSLGVHLTVRSVPEERLGRKNRREKEYAKTKIPDFLPGSGCSFDGKEVPDDEVKSRSSSYNNDTSIISSGISVSSYGGLSVHTMGKSFPKLSPIASISSANNSYSIQSCYTTYHMLLPPLSSSPSDGSNFIACSTASEHSHAHHQPFETMPSSTDAQGYATLRAINRHRVHSMGIHTGVQSSGTRSAVRPDRSPSPSSSCSSSNSGIYNENDIFSNNRTLFSSLNLPAGTMTEMTVEIEAPASDHFVDDDTKVFIGIVIPVSLALLLEPPACTRQPYQSLDTRESAEVTPDASSDYRTHMDTLPPASLDGDDALELHTSRNCLLCYRVQVSDDDGIHGQCQCLHQEETTHVEEAMPGHAWPSSTKSSLQPQTLKHIISASSIASTSSAEGMAPADPAVDRLLIRREVLRFVTNLSGSVAAKAAEQGMLNLKQRFPRGFQEDICLYSEICLQLSAYNFRLPARKFVQEIFQDINCEQLRTYAREIIRKKASHSLQELDDEGSEDRSTSIGTQE